jgi:isopentenyl phosphate kinase
MNDGEREGPCREAGEVPSGIVDVTGGIVKRVLQYDRQTGARGGCARNLQHSRIEVDITGGTVYRLNACLYLDGHVEGLADGDVAGGGIRGDDDRSGGTGTRAPDRNETQAHKQHPPDTHW